MHGALERDLVYPRLVSCIAHLFSGKGTRACLTPRQVLLWQGPECPNGKNQSAIKRPHLLGPQEPLCVSEPTSVILLDLGRLGLLGAMPISHQNTSEVLHCPGDDNNKKANQLYSASIDSTSTLSQLQHPHHVISPSVSASEPTRLVSSTVGTLGPHPLSPEPK